MSVSLFMSACAALVLGSPVAAQTSQTVQFDMPHVVECRDVTTPEFANLHPEERLVEARLQISALIRQHGDSLVEFLYRIHSPGRTAVVVDFAPRTTLEPELAGNLSVNEKNETSRSLGLTLSGQYDCWLKATGVGELGKKSLSDLKFERPTPMQLVAASGTLDRGHGVYFKLKPSPRTTLEGDKSFTVVLRVPWDWRADTLWVQCTASGQRANRITQTEEPQSLGSRLFHVALCSEGDAEARRAAERLVAAEEQLRQLAERRRTDIQHSQLPTVAHRIGALLDVYSPRLPENWLDQIISSNQPREPEFAQALPSDVRSAVVEFVAAHQAFHDLR